MRVYLAALDCYDPDGPTNLITSDDLTSWSVVGTPVIASGIADPDGGTSAYTLEDDNTVITEARFLTVAIASDGTKDFVWAVKKYTAPSSGAQRFGIFDATATAWRGQVNITWSGTTPVVAVTAGTLDGVRYLGDDWWAIYAKATGVLSANTNRMYAYAATIGTETGKIGLWRPCVYDSTEDAEVAITRALVGAGERAAVRTLYVGNAPYTSGPTDDQPNTRFLPRIKRAPVVSLSMYAPGARTGGGSEAAPGDVIFENGDNALVDWFGYYFDGREFRGYIGEADDISTLAFPDDFELVDRFTMVGLYDGYTDATLKLRDKRRTLDVPLQDTKYVGDWATDPESLEGDTDVRGKPVPWAFGKVHYATPSLVNPGKHIYQFHDGVLDSVDGVYDSGVALHLNPTGLTSITATPYTAQPSGLAYGGGYWVAGGSVSGTPTLTNSTDAETFTARDNTTLSNAPNGIAYADTPDAFFAFGNGAELVTSDDGGANWTSRTSGFTADAIRAGEWGPGYAVIVGDNGKTAKSNADLSSWTFNASGSAQSLNSVAYGNGVWLAHSTSGDLYRSTDGASWSALTAPASGRLSFGGGLFVLVSTAGAIYTSSEGEVWTMRFSPATGTIYAPTYVDGFGWIAIEGVHVLVSHGIEADQWVRTRVTSGPTFGNATRIATDGSKILFTVNDGAEYVVRTLGVETYASEADLLDESLRPASGLAKAYLAGGYVRLGSEPVGSLTGDVTQGDTAADRTLGKLLAGLCAAAGLTATTDYSTDDLDALDALTSDVVGLYVDRETTVRALVDQACAGQGVWYCGDSLGVLRFGRLDAPEDASPIALEITETGANAMRSPLLRIASGDVADGVPYYRTTVRHTRNYSPAATNITEIQRPEWREEYAEDLAVLAKHPLARQATIDSLLTNGTDADDEAVRVQALRGVQRHPYRTALTDTTTNRAALRIGVTVNVTTSAYGFTGGKSLTVIGLHYDREAEMIELTLWG